MKIKNLLFCSLFIIISACQDKKHSVGLQSTTVLDSSKFTKYEDENYSIQYPSDWILENNPAADIAFYIYLNNHSYTDEIGENINLWIVPVGSDITLEAFTKKSIQEFKAQGEVISSEKLLTPTKEYQRVITRMKMYGEDVKFLQHYILKNTKVYVLTFTAIERNFEHLEKSAEQVMLSFEVN
jgi:hypothetical protein